jgi:hypothetical protein
MFHFVAAVFFILLTLLIVAVVWVWLRLLRIGRMVRNLFKRKGKQCLR